MLQKSWIGIADSNNTECIASLKFRKSGIIFSLQISMNIRNRIPMWIDRRLSEQAVEASLQLIGSDMLQAFGFLMDFIPTVSKILDEEHLPESMAPHHPDCQPTP